MAIPNKQIGWSEKANLLWEISRQLDRLNSQMCVGTCPTTTTTTTVCNCREKIVTEIPYNYYDCQGINRICPVGGFCKVTPTNCIDISLPYSGITPSETITESCNCNP